MSGSSLNRDDVADALRKEARAEQNRKAQQIFRRKREEKIKQLELDSMALGNTRQRLMAAEQRLADMALVRYSSAIELSFPPPRHDVRSNSRNSRPR